MKRRQKLRARAPRIAAKHAELLRVVEGLGLEAQEVERAAGLPQAWLSKAKKGEREGPKADDGWDKLAAWLASRSSTGAAIAAVAKEIPAIAPAPSSSPSGPSSSTDISAEEIQRVEREIAKAFETVTTAEELLAIDKRLGAETARGILDNRRSNALRVLAIEIRQALELALSEKAQQRFANLVPMTREEAEAFYAAREKGGVKPLKPGEAAAAPGGPS